MLNIAFLPRNGRASPASGLSLRKICRFWWGGRPPGGSGMACRLPLLRAGAPRLLWAGTPILMCRAPPLAARRSPVPGAAGGLRASRNMAERLPEAEGRNRKENVDRVPSGAVKEVPAKQAVGLRAREHVLCGAPLLDRPEALPPG
jgi:hypothetical protein